MQAAPKVEFAHQFRVGQLVVVEGDASGELGEIQKLVGDVLTIRWPSCTEIVNLRSEVWRNWLQSLKVISQEPV